MHDQTGAVIKARDAYYEAEERFRALMDPPPIYEDHKAEIDAAFKDARDTQDAWLKASRDFH